MTDFSEEIECHTPLHSVVYKNGHAIFGDSVCLKNNTKEIR